MIRNWLNRVFHLIIGVVVCIVLPFIVKQFILKPVRINIIGDNAFRQLFQFTFSLFVMIGGYIAYIRIFEKREASELSWKRFFPDTAKGIIEGITTGKKRDGVGNVN